MPVAEEMLVSVVECNESTTVATSMRSPPPSGALLHARSTVIATRAPQGQLDEFLESSDYKNIGKSIQPNQEWSTRLVADQQAAFQQFHGQ